MSALAKVACVFKWGTRKDDERTLTHGPDPALDRVARSKVMPKFVAALAGRPSPGTPLTPRATA